MINVMTKTTAANNDGNYHPDCKISEPQMIIPKPVMVVRPDGYTYATLNETQRFKCGLGRQAVQGMGIPNNEPLGNYSNAEVINVHSEASRIERRNAHGYQTNINYSGVGVIYTKRQENSSTHRQWIRSQRQWTEAMTEEANLNYHDARLATAHATGSSDDET